MWKRRTRQRMALLSAILLAVALLSPMMALAGLAAAEGALVSTALVTIDLTGLMQAVIAVLAALITGRLLPWIKARTSQAQQERLDAVIRTLVYAAQQLYKTGEIQDRLDYVQEGLLQRGFAVDRDAIEAAVRQLNLMDITIVGEAIKKEEKIDE